MASSWSAAEQPALPATNSSPEARFDRWALAAQMMVAAARAVASRPAGAHSLLDIPPAAFAETDRVASMVQAI